MDGPGAGSQWTQQQVVLQQQIPVTRQHGGDGMPVLQGESHTCGVFLEEVAYFLEDMHVDLRWLLRAAHQPSGEAFIRGDEELEEVGPDMQAIIENVCTRADEHMEAHTNQVRAKIVIIPSVSPKEHELLAGLRRLKFHCRGRIEVFRCMKEANNATIWTSYHNFVASQQPQWMVTTDGLGQKTLFAQCTVVVPFWLDRAKQEVRVLSVWCPEKKRHWAFPEGDILRGVDRNLYDAARRQFHEEVGVFFGRDWRGCFMAELPADGNKEISSEHIVKYVSLEKDGVRYPCRPHFFVQVTDEFYEATLHYQDEAHYNVIRLPRPEVDCVRWDDDRSAHQVHTEGLRFLGHDEARWLDIEFQTGRLYSEDNRQLRKENSDLMKQRPQRVWAHWARLLGVEAPERASLLPADFPPEGPFAVRMSGIDKMASDEHIAEFFEASAIKTKLVKQFDVPKHTARIEFHDINSLEEALCLSGRNLQRRKVKVELWADADCEGVEAVPGQRPLQQFDGKLPEEGPWQCRCRGLDRSVTRDDLGYFFWDRNCQVHDVQHPMKGERHAGLVEFVDADSLRRALSLNMAIFRGREMAIDLIQKGSLPQHDASASGDGGSGYGAGGGQRRSEQRGGGGLGGGGRDSRDRQPMSGGYNRDSERAGLGRGGGKGGLGRGRPGGLGGGPEREPPSREEFGSERVKLQLKPRSVPVPDQDGQTAQAEGMQPRAPSGNIRPDPFGGARPRDERYKPTRADSDDNWRR